MKEKIFSKGIFMILSLVSLIMTLFVILQLIFGPLGTKPAPNFILILMVVFFILLTWNFSFLTVELNDSGVSVKYGIFQLMRKWEDLDGCEADEQNRFYGWGIRFGKYKDRWIWVYNVIGGDQVVFLSKSGRKRSFMISTKKAGEILSVADGYLKRRSI